MKRLTLSALAAAAIAAQLAVVAAPVAAAQPTTTTHRITLSATLDGVLDLPALNSQFTSLTIKVEDGTANWGADELGYRTTYTNDTLSTPAPMTTGGDPAIPGQGPLRLEHTQVGAVIFRVDGGDWQEIDGAPAVVSSGSHVQVAYNDRPGSYDDNFGSLSLTVVRSKA
jgi:hypothetical protein